MASASVLERFISHAASIRRRQRTVREMLRSALVLLVACGLAAGVVEVRVVGGGVATPGALPWQVFVEGVRDGEAVSGCGATLVSAQHVLTAAQCLGDSIQIVRVYLGAHNISASNEANRVVMETGVFALHPDFSTQYYENDVAVVTLPRQVTLSEFIAVAALPTGADVESDLIGAEGIFAGWGSSTGAIGAMSDVLHSTRNSVVAQTDCVGHYGAAWMSSNKLCVETTDLNGPCYGDAGSALVREADATVLGLFSFLDVQTCLSGFAVGFTRVGAYVDWINTIIAAQ